MKKADIANHIAEVHGLAKAKAAEIVNDVFTHVTAGVKAGEEVTLDGFGKFFRHHKPAGTGRHPGTGETIQVAAKEVPKFKPAKALHEAINGT